MRAIAVVVGAIVLAGCLVEVGPEPVSEQEEPLFISVCNPAVYYVSKTNFSLAKIPTGAALNPFPKINDALDAPAPYCGVVVKIGTGTWFENLVIDKKTTLIGAGQTNTKLVGRISNSSASSLTLKKMSIECAAPPGAVVVSNPYTTTSVYDVTIKSAWYAGIRQTGGTLKASNVLIRNTVAGASYIHHGAGILLNGGATGFLTDVTLRNNVQGLVLVGAATKAKAEDLWVEGSTHNTYFDYLLGATAPRDGFAAVEVRDGALLWAKGLDILDSDVQGLYVHHGAQAHVEDADLRGTHSAGTADMGGINAAVRSEGATLEVINSVVHDADLAGMQAVAAYFKVANSYIINNPIGLNVQFMPADQSVECARLNVYWDNDSADIDTDTIYVPTAGNPLAGVTGPQNSTTVEPGLVCPTVLWP
jgi:hypothetical protein